MAKELTISNKSSLAVLNKAKSLLNITNSLLKKENKLQNDDWIYKLWKWADENNIPDLEWVEEELQYETNIWGLEWTEEDLQANNNICYSGYWKGIPRDRENLLNLVNFENNEFINNELKEDFIIDDSIKTIITIIKNKFGDNYILQKSKNYLVFNYSELGFVIVFNLINKLETNYKIFENIYEEYVEGKSHTIMNTLLFCNKYLVVIEQYGYDCDLKSFVYIFDLETKIKINNFDCDDDIFYTNILISMDCKYIVSSNPFYFALRKIDSSEIIHFFESECGHGETININIKKEYIVSYNWYNREEIWNIKTGKEITNIKNFIELNLENMQLTSLTKEIFLLTNIEKLNLKNNLLETLSKDISNFKHLRVLNLENNNLKRLPDDIISINLIELNLKGNPNLILSKSQKEWIKKLQKNNFKILI